MMNSSSVLFQKGTEYENPFVLLRYVQGEPSFTTRTHKKVNSKTGEIKYRAISNPNAASRQLHKLFLTALEHALKRLKGVSRVLVKQPSATAFKPESWYVQNADKHRYGQHFYITDIHNAYASVRLELLAQLLVYVFHYEEHGPSFSHDAILHLESASVELQQDPLYAPLLSFLRIYFSGKFGEGLVFGGVASPFLFNLFMEAFVDSPIRVIIAKRDRHEHIVYTRYADDLVFSSKGYIGPTLRCKIEKVVTRVGLLLNCRKTKVLLREQGTVFVTKTGISRTSDELVFPKGKRKALRNRLHLFLIDKAPNIEEGKSFLEVTRGYVADFLGYMRARGKPTASDQKLLELCHEFEQIAGKRKIV